MVAQEPNGARFNGGAPLFPRGPMVVVYDDGKRRRARCTCKWFRRRNSCRHAWIAALLQAGLNRLGLNPMPTFCLYFGRPAPEKGNICHDAGPRRNDR